MSSGGEDNEEYTVSPSSDGHTTQGGGSSMMFEYPTSRRESHPVRPFVVHNATAVPVSPAHRHAQDVSRLISLAGKYSFCVGATLLHGSVTVDGYPVTCRVDN